MKRIIFLLAFAVLFVGCKKFEIPVDDDTVTVEIGLSGEVSAKEDLLTKGLSSGYLIGIQVYQDGDPYAYGLFSGIGFQKIKLHTGREYSFKSQALTSSSMIYNPGQLLYHGYGSSHYYHGDYLWTSYDWTTDYYYYAPTGTFYSTGGYGEPFSLVKNGDYSWGYLSYSPVYYSSGKFEGYLFSHEVSGARTIVTGETNGFTYSSTDEMNITSSYACADDPIHLDRYYGESGPFQAQRGDQNMSIDMKHLVYGIQCNVLGVTDGTATITIKNGNNVLLEKTDISGDYHSEDEMFAFSDMHSAWQYADNYTENVTVSMTWLRGVGVNQNLGSQVIQVKRNCRNVITVSLNATKSGAALDVVSESEEICFED